MPRLFYSISMSLALSPLNIYEWKCYDKKIKEITIEKPPIFIIGHWRTGTTYLHNLLSQDNQFGYPTTFQTVAPGLFIGSEKLIKPIVVSSLPAKRPQDDVDLGADFPSEEEYAIGNLSPYSFYHGWCFPKNMEFYNKFVYYTGSPLSFWSSCYGIQYRFIDHFWISICYIVTQTLAGQHENKTVFLSRVKSDSDILDGGNFFAKKRNDFFIFFC